MLAVEEALSFSRQGPGNGPRGRPKRPPAPQEAQMGDNTVFLRPSAPFFGALAAAGVHFRHLAVKRGGEKNSALHRPPHGRRPCAWAEIEVMCKAITSMLLACTTHTMLVERSAAETVKALKSKVGDLESKLEDKYERLGLSGTTTRVRAGGQKQAADCRAGGALQKESVCANNGVLNRPSAPPPNLPPASSLGIKRPLVRSFFSDCAHSVPHSALSYCPVPLE